MRAEVGPGVVGITAAQAAEMVGMSRRTWDEAWKGGAAPEPAYPFATDRNPRWSRDELRAWVAFHYPVLERWRPMWTKLLESGAWAPSEIVIKETGGGSAA